MKMINFGSLNVDMVYTVDHCVRPGETTASSRLEFFCGGKGLNQSAALARAGARVYHAGCVGEDGGRLLNVLNESSVDTSLVRVSKSPSGHAIIQVDANGQNSILLFGGANKEISDCDIEKAFEGCTAGDRLFLQNEISRIPEIINAAHARGMEIVFNPSPFGKEILDFPLEKVDWFVVNETEAFELTGKSTAKEIIAEFEKNFPASKLLVTFGERGSVCKMDGELLTQEIFKVDVVDTTGAGDTFLGFFFALLDGFGAKKALKYASAAAAVAVSRNGASASIPDLTEVEVFLRGLCGN